ncbi:MAG: response regulator transcription factor [Desulfobulbaceae bacterium]|nr:response regulator transcription factor [Desulfobulbaceae bacterium]
MKEPHAISVILVDDHHLFRESLKMMISEWSDIKIVGEAGDGKRCMELFTELDDITVAILDITMQGPEGLMLAEKIKKISHSTEILILTMHDDRDYIYQAFKNGSRGYILKSDSAVELQKAIRTVAGGKTYLSPDIATDFIDDLITRIDIKAKTFNLSSREQEVCGNLIQGDSTEKIAQQLEISPKTVRVHIANVMKKYHCKTRADLIVRLREKDR